MPFVWSIGTILGPFVGGTFADPHDSFPNVFPEGGLFHRYPYLLPNLVCSALMVVSIVLGWILLEETHPDMQPRVALPTETYQSEETPLLQTSDAIKRPAVDMRDDNYGTVHSSHPDAGVEWTSAAEKREPSTNIYTKRIMTLIVALCIFTYHSMTYDHLMPIFFEDGPKGDAMSLLAAAATSSAGSGGMAMFSAGGLGLTVRAVGMIMAVNGGIALFVQAVVFPIAADRFGVYKLFIIVTVLHPIAYMLVPNLLLVPESLLYPAIYFCLAVRNFLSIILYPLLLILLKEATPSNKALGKVNGLAASAGAGCRMIAPPIAGWLYTFGSKMDCTALAWYGSAAVAVVGAFQCFSVPRSKVEDQTEESGFHVDQNKQSYVTVHEVLSDDGRD